MYAQSHLILASASPRRRELLKEIGVPFSVLVAGIDETPRSGESPRDYVRRNALEKSLASVNLCGPTHRSALVLGADTVVVSPGGEILEKPKDAADAVRMLSLLSGKPHEVLTGVALVRASDRAVLWSEVVTTAVVFRPMDQAEIRAYVETGEPLDKAGAYAVQGKASVFVCSISGSYTNVVGMPLCEVAEALKRFAGIAPFSANRGGA